MIEKDTKEILDKLELLNVKVEKVITGMEFFKETITDNKKGIIQLRKLVYGHVISFLTGAISLLIYYITSGGIK